MSSVGAAFAFASASSFAFFPSSSSPLAALERRLSGESAATDLRKSARRSLGTFCGG